MEQHKSFLTFETNITLDSNKKDMLKKQRDILRTDIKKGFTAQGYNQPQFAMQGSFSLKTSLNPLTDKDGNKQEVDIDDGVYIKVDSDNSENWLSPKDAHDIVYNAVNKNGRTVEDNDPCIRIIYSRDYHVDLPVYIMYTDINNQTQVRYGRKDYKEWIDRDPKLFKDWFYESISKDNEQLRRLVKYLKAWKDYRLVQNKESKGLGGFQLTVIAEKYQYKCESDEECFYHTVKKINEALQNNQIPPLYNLSDMNYPKENVLERYSDARIQIFKNNFKKLYNEAYIAFSETDIKKSSELWQKVFGDRFPISENSCKKNEDTLNLGAPYIMTNSESRGGSGNYA